MEVTELVYVHGEFFEHRDEIRRVFDMNQKKWDKEDIAERLGLSPALQKHELISTLLTLLETSPLLASCSSFPKLAVTVPRKRDDYKVWMKII